MNREDYKLLPLAAIGLIKGIGEVIIKPFAIDQTEKVRHVTKAAIHYYGTAQEDDHGLHDTNRGG